MQIGQIHTEIRVQACMVQLRKGRKKERSEETDKDRTTDRNSTDNMEPYQVTPTPVPHPSGGQPIPPPPLPPTPPFFLAPHHAAGNPTVNPHADTSGTTHSRQIIQRAAAMRVTRCARASSDSKGTVPVAQMSFVPPADSPFRSRSYATFMTDLELRQARAEMEECYRRRARRVGLEDTLPVGRPMTDEEIEDLQWQLRDFGPANGYGSRGRKRT